MGRRLVQACPTNGHVQSTESNAELRVKVSPWIRNRLHLLVENGTFRTFGQAVDVLIKRALASGDLAEVVQWRMTIPDHQAELKEYYPLMARDMAPGVWSSLDEVERRLCVLTAFYSELDEVEMARWAQATPSRVKLFRVSNLGLESVRIGEQRQLLAYRLHYWREKMIEAADPDHPLQKESNRLLGNRLFAPAEKRMLLNAMGIDPSGERPIVTNPHEVDMEFMDYAASIQMTPERYVSLYAKVMGESVQDIVLSIMRRYSHGLEEESEVVSEESDATTTDSP